MQKSWVPHSIPPFRPILASIGTYNKNLAKFLSNLFQPRIPFLYVASDTFNVVREINGFFNGGEGLTWCSPCSCQLSKGHHKNVWLEQGFQNFVLSSLRGRSTRFDFLTRNRTPTFSLISSTVNTPILIHFRCAFRQQRPVFPCHYCHSNNPRGLLSGNNNTFILLKSWVYL